MGTTSSTTFINAPKEYIRVLFEEAYKASVQELTFRWKEYENYGLGDLSRAKLCLAYNMAQDYKNELDYYGILAFYYGTQQPKHLNGVKKELYKEALSCCDDEKLKERLRQGVEWCEKDCANSELEGFADDAAAKVEGIDIYVEKIGKEATLHDAYIRDLHFDRNRNVITLAIDTWGVYDNSDYDTQVITIEFSDVLTFETNIDPGNDYAWTFRCFTSSDRLVFELESAHIEIICGKMRIVSIENMRHDHVYQKGELEQ